MVTARVMLAAGFEEIETATVVDVLRRAGVQVTVTALYGREPVVGSRGLAFVPDAWFGDGSVSADLLVIPGGLRGAEALAAHEGLRQLVASRVENGEMVAAICAGPLVLDAAGVLGGRAFTCHPSVTARFSVPPTSTDAVVDAGVIVTSRGPATAMAFALHLVARLRGPEVRAELAAALLV